MVTQLRTGLEAAKKFALKHSPELLAGASIIAGAAAGYFAFKGGYDTAVDISRMEEPTKKEMAKVVAKNSWPALVAEAVNVAVNVVNAKNGIKTQKSLASVANAYAMQAEAFDIYRRHTVERLGEKKEGEMRGEIAEELVKRDPPSETVIFNTGQGTYLFKDRISGRYFRSDIDYIRKQQVKINGWLAAGEDWVSVNDWYSMIGLETLEDLDEMGWNVEEGVHFDFDSCLSPDNEPCIVINYDISPRIDFRSMR